MTTTHLRALLGHPLPEPLYPQLAGRTAGLLRAAWPGLAAHRTGFHDPARQAVLIADSSDGPFGDLVRRDVLLSGAKEAAEGGQPGVWEAARDALCAPPERGLPVLISHSEGGAVLVLTGSPDEIAVQVREYLITTDPDYPEVA